MMMDKVFTSSFLFIVLSIVYFRPVAFSLMASFMSAVTLIGVSNENYQYGTQFIVINISYGLATPIVAYLFLPVFYNMRVTSAYEVRQFTVRHKDNNQTASF